ncbi:MAG: hypothetical protein ACFCU9_12300 [Cyanophyceae cyanobacterium]
MDAMDPAMDPKASGLGIVDLIFSLGWGLGCDVLPDRDPWGSVSR